MLSLLAAVTQLACAPVPGSAALLRPGTVVLLGEIHGTEEGPASVSKLACHALEHGLGVVVALEIPVAERDYVEQYLAGGPSEDLVSSPFWSREYQDGRSSAAMLGLLTTLRTLSSGGAVQVLLIDDPDAPGGRDRFMAERLAEAVKASPTRMILALTGNLHNRLTVGTRFDPAYEPMGFLLSRRIPERERSIVSLQITHGGGSAWVCTGSTPEDCGARELSGRDAAPGIELDAEQSDDGERPFSGRWHVGRITASPPARDGR